MSILRATFYLACALAALIFVSSMVSTVAQADIAVVPIEPLDKSIVTTAEVSRGALRPLPRDREQWEQERKEIRQALDSSLGVSRIRSRDPLNAVLSERKVLAGGITVRAVRYDAEPGMTVSALLFEPPSRDPHPAVVLFAGHTGEGKASAEYVPLIAAIVRQGIAVLAVDEIGGGERAFTGQHEPELIRYGVTPGGIQVRDGMRAVDFLESLPEIDRYRIGAVGHSGGGFQSFYLAALDERIAAATAIKYVSSFVGMIKSGEEHTLDNYLIAPLRAFEQRHVLAAIAPRPFLVVASTGDIFPFAETRHTVDEASKVYRLLGAGSLLSFAWSTGDHDLSSFDVAQTADFLARHLGATRCDITEREAIRAVKKGTQIRVGIPEEGRKDLRGIVARLKREVHEGKKRRNDIFLGEGPLSAVTFRDAFSEDRTVRRRFVALGSEGRFRLSGELLEPVGSKPSHALVVPFRNGKGRAICRAEISQGNACFLAELREGSTARWWFPRFNDRHYRSRMNALLMGTSLDEMREDDLMLVSRYLAEEIRLVPREAVAFLSDDGSVVFSLAAAEKTAQP